MQRLLTLVAIGTALATPGCRSGDDEIRITSVRLEDTGTQLRAHVGVHNGTAFSLYVYAPGQDARAADIAAEREILTGEWRR